MALPSRRLITAAIAGRLTGVTNAVGYLGQVGRPLTIPEPAGWVADPSEKAADDPRVKPYYILFPPVGGDGPDAPLTGGDDGLALPFGVQVAGGDPDDVVALVDRVETRLIGWTPALTGVVFSPIRRQPDYRPDLQVDDTKQPERSFAPLRFTLFATT